MSLINTTHGPLEGSLLKRTVGFEDREEPDEFVVWVEWRLRADYSVTGKAGELVRRDAHVILKQPSVVADALVGGL